MSAFFEGVGSGDTAGVWEETPVPAPSSRPATPRPRPPCAPRKRRWGHDPDPRPRPGGRLLGRGLRLHGHQGPAGDHRRPGGLREPAGHQRPALHRRPAPARTAHRRHRPGRRGAGPDRHRGRDEAGLEDARPRPARRGGHRLHRRDDRRRRDARGHQHRPLPAAHHRRGPVAVRRPGADVAVDPVRPQEGTAEAPPAGPTAKSPRSTSSAPPTACSTCRATWPRSAA